MLFNNCIPKKPVYDVNILPISHSAILPFCHSAIRPISAVAISLPIHFLCLYSGVDDENLCGPSCQLAVGTTLDCKCSIHPSRFRVQGSDSRELLLVTGSLTSWGAMSSMLVSKVTSCSTTKPSLRTCHVAHADWLLC